MASYKRPLSKAELRFINRQKRRTVIWCGVLVGFVLAAMVGVLWLMSSRGPH